MVIKPPFADHIICSLILVYPDYIPDPLVLFYMSSEYPHEWPHVLNCQHRRKACNGHGLCLAWAWCWISQRVNRGRWKASGWDPTLSECYALSFLFVQSIYVCCFNPHCCCLPSLQFFLGWIPIFATQSQLFLFSLLINSKFLLVKTPPVCFDSHFFAQAEKAASFSGPSPFSGAETGPKRGAGAGWLGL